MGIKATLWGSKDTKGRTHIEEILDFDILVNCALMTKKSGPWLTKEMLQSRPSQLSVLSDVSCDPTGPCNPLPIYNHATTMDQPAIYISKGESKERLAITAIDHLPSLLPKESSEDYAEQLFPYILKYMEGKIEGTVWDRALTSFYKNFYRHLDQDSLSDENSEINDFI
jgi:saccharopine dehydrogenase (NAD+, L-lysine forming)